MIPPAANDLAIKACRHLVHRSVTDSKLRYLMIGTETYGNAVDALLAAHGQTPDNPDELTCLLAPADVLARCAQGPKPL